eukprot:1031748-Rhodomonas_salina.1
MRHTGVHPSCASRADPPKPLNPQRCIPNPSTPNTDARMWTWVWGGAGGDEGGPSACRPRRHPGPTLAPSLPPSLSF